VLEPDEVLVESIGRAGWALASDGSLTVAIDTFIDAELGLEARLNDLIRAIQIARREAGLEIVDRIRVWIPDEELLAFSERIAEETLAVEVSLGPELRVEKA
jgi:isoleucyl-tRNA synthetase